MYAAIAYIATETTRLCVATVGFEIPITSLTVFAHFDDEYEHLVTRAHELGTVINFNNGPRVKLHAPLQIEANEITELRIRKPDLERPHVGCNDFIVPDYRVFKKQYLETHHEHLRLITRSEYEMIEFHDDEFDMLAYVVSD